MVSCCKPPFVFLTGVEACCLGWAYKSVCVCVWLSQPPREFLPRIAYLQLNLHDNVFVKQHKSLHCVQKSPCSHTAPCTYGMNVALSLTYSFEHLLKWVRSHILCWGALLICSPCNCCKAWMSKHMHNSMWPLYIKYCRKQMSAWQQIEASGVGQWECGIRVNTP